MGVVYHRNDRYEPILCQFSVDDEPAVGRTAAGGNGEAELS